MEYWGDRLASIIRHRKLSQRKIAAKLGVSPQAVSKWVAGGEIEHLTLRALAALLDVNWVWLRYGDEALYESWSLVGANDRAAIARHRILRDALKNEHRYRATCGLLNIGTWEISFLATKSYWSPATRLLLGVGPIIEPSQSFFRTLVCESDLPHVDATIREASKSTMIFWQRFKLRAEPDKTLYAVGRSMRDRRGKVDRVLGLISNETLFDRHQLSVVTELLPFPETEKSLEFGT